MRWLILSIALVIGALYSQEPSHNKAIAQEQKEAEKKQTNPEGTSTRTNVVKPQPVKDTGKKPDANPGEKLNIDRAIANYTGQLADFTKWLVIVTAVLCLITGGLVWMARRQEISTRTIERAYMNIFPQDFVLDKATGRIEANVKIRNVGKTPAEVTYFWMNAVFTHGALPVPDENKGTREHVSMNLVMNQSMLVTHSNIIDAKSIPSIIGVENGTQTLYFVGYVDYIDKFGGRHRCGFGRVYDPKRQIKFLSVSQKGFNYDRPRKKGEGYDWDRDGPV